MAVKEGPCDACGKVRRLRPDLKHNRLRGHICSRCIDLLALAEDDRHVLQGAADYLVVDHLENLEPDG